MNLPLKPLTIAFYSALAGIIVCFGMAISLALHQHAEQKKAESAPLTLPLPAEAK